MPQEVLIQALINSINYCIFYLLFHLTVRNKSDHIYMRWFKLLAERII